MAGGVSPFVGETGQLINNYATAAPQSVSANTIASQMSPYMNQYVNLALQPQLEQMNQQFAAQNKAFDAGATGAGAFGDTSYALGKTNLTNQQDIARQGLIGNAYNAAFNTAIGAGAQDVANNLNAQTTNAGLAETALGRQLTGANALYGQGTGATNLINALGGQQTAQSQAQLNAPYNQWLMAQQYPFQTTSLVNQSLQASNGAVPVTTTGTTSAPDNSGYGILGSIAGAVAAPFTGGLSLAIPGMMSAAQQIGSGSPMSFQQYGNGNYYPAFADGGEPPVDQPSIVGERGPELFVPKTAGSVVPYEKLKAAMAKKKGVKTKAARSAEPLGLAGQLGLVA